MASKNHPKFVAATMVPTVKAGDVIRVHVPELPNLWKVDAVLVHERGWGYFLQISQRVDGMKVGRVIAPRGFEIISSPKLASAAVRGLRETELRLEVRAIIREICFPLLDGEQPPDPLRPLPLSAPASV